MDEIIDKSEFDKFPQYTKENIEKQVNSGKTSIEIETDLRTNPRYQEFFNRFRAYSVESFIKHYSFKKSMYLQYGEMYKETQERESLQFLEEAQERIWDIQQKKLFNLQCQWRAELIKLPGVETTFDFLYWEKHIKTCPFLDPITEEEFSLYVEYVLSDSYEDVRNIGVHWQNYDLIKSNYNDDDDDSMIVPEWYLLYDNRMGTSHLLSLPDIRGDKEEVYLTLTREHRRLEYEKKNALSPQPPPDTRPYLEAYNIQTIEDFIRKFEDKKLLMLCRAFEKSSSTDEEEELDASYEFLKSIDEPIELLECDDWREAINLTATHYRKKFIARECEPAYRDYLQRIELGIPFEVSDRELKRSNIIENLEEAQKKMLLEGRVLNGEPADFNF
jgi:hypothetical protein